MFLYVAVEFCRDIGGHKDYTRVQLRINFTSMQFSGLCVFLSLGSSVDRCRDVRRHKNSTCIKVCITLSSKLVPFK